jgi:DNA-binding NtrC family response regulator
MRELLQMRLRAWGFEVRPASDGQEARKLVESWNPDLVVSDVLMPELSGLDLLRYLKSGNPDRPILLMTVQDVEAVRSNALQMLLDYSWPGNVRELKNVIERAVILAQSRWIETSHLPAYVQEPVTALASTPPSLTAAEAEKELILKTLKEVGNKKSEAARRLRLDVKTIRNKLKSYGMSAGSP